MSEGPLLSVVVPTYNERDNVRALYEGLARALAGYSFELIFVDDGSPDGTADVVREISSRDPRVRLIVRRGERGLGTAVLAGVRAARGQYVAKMDADLQHPPEAVRLMLEAALATGADVVVATRYARGGGVEGWPLRRYVVSRLAGLAIRLLLPAAGRVSDPTSGLFLIRRGSARLERATRGFEVLLDVLCQNPTARVVEVPYVFRARASGRSKLGGRAALELLGQLLRYAGRCGARAP